MSTGLDASQIEEALQALESLGYRNPTAEDIALTVQHVRQARQRERSRQRPAPRGAEESARPPSSSPPRGVNDATMLPHTDAGAEGEAEAASQQLWPGLSSHSIRGGRTTPMNSTGTAGCARPLTSRSTQGYPQQGYRGGGTAVKNAYKGSGQGIRRPNSSNAFRPLQGKDAAQDIIWIPTANASGHPQNLAEYVSPPARLERHLKKHEKGLKNFYVKRHVNAENNFFEENDSNGSDAPKQQDNVDTSQAYEDKYDDNVATAHRVQFRYPEVPEIPMRENQAVLNQHNANVLYSFTGDRRYKYRGGAGAPLSTVLDANGSTLRQRADPVQRGRQMRELWNKDRFLSQQGRKEDRWRIRQNMLPWDV